MSAQEPVAERVGAVDYVVVGWLTLLTMVLTVYVVLFLPLYAGTVPLPLSALVGAGAVFWAVRTSYAIAGSMRAAFAPAAGWLVASFWLSTYSTLGFGLVIGDWRAQLMLGLGALSAAVALATCWGRHVVATGVRGVTPNAAVTAADGASAGRGTSAGG